MDKQKRAAGRRTGWRQWTADEAREVLEAWRESGLPLATFARKRGLTAERVRWWRQRLGDWKAAGASRTSLVPVVITGEMPTRSAVVMLRAGALVVEVADVEAVPPSWLSAFMLGLTRPAA
jgi:hypothetical protein